MTRPITRLINLAQPAELWQADGRAMATVGTQHWPLTSGAFKAWLINRARAAELQPTIAVVNDAIGILSAQALVGPTYPLWRRTGANGDEVWLDLGEHFVCITQAGWTVQEESPLRFLRPAGQRSLPSPTREEGGGFALVRSALHLASPEQWVMLLSWLAHCLQPHGAFPILSLCGPQGSGKSTTARAIKRLVDPASVELRFEPKDIAALGTMANNTWVLAIDNVSWVRPWLSDALCGLSTGITFATRQLYTDADEFQVSGYRPTIVTSIGNWATRSDLLDRVVQLQLEPLPGYLDDARVLAQVDACGPTLLADLLDVVVESLQGSTEYSTHRFHGFLRTAQIVGDRLGVDGLGAYEAIRGEVEADSLANDPIADLLGKLAPFAGGVADLLDRLNQQAQGGRDRWRTWPRSPEQLGRQLRRLAPTLATTGLLIEFRRGHGGTQISLRRGNEG